MEMTSLVYKIAEERAEFEQINQLNYETFVEEIPQHEKNDSRELVDRFDRENTYIIAKAAEEVVGMIAVRGNRPFSLDGKLANLDSYLPAGARPCEVRLLSIKPAYRKGYVFYKLCENLIAFCLENHYNMALISGVERQLRLYRRIGFKEFAEMTGSGDARFQPMYLTKEQFESSTGAFSRLADRAAVRKEHSFLPGPVSFSEKVAEAMSGPVISHRSQQFQKELNSVRSNLTALVKGNKAAVMTGTGTLANDAVACQLKKISGSGLILANGEFGFRLIDHAERMGLDYQVLAKEWANPIAADEVEQLLKENSRISWIWSVHCETSTGYLYDIPGILDVCKRYGAELCLDACSSVGIVDCDFSEVYLAAAVSGKGLGAYPGLAIVFHREEIFPDSRIPRYLDLGLYNGEGVPFTHSSNLVKALGAGLEEVRPNGYVSMAKRIRSRLKEAGLEVLGDEKYSPGIITVKIPAGQSSKEVGDRLKRRGLLLSYESGYLLERNWIQAALMGSQSEETADMLIEWLVKSCRPAESKVMTR